MLIAQPILPYALAFAAGAMIYVVIKELIPESQASEEATDRFDRFRPDEDPDRVLHSVAQECEKFRVGLIAADGGGNGHVLNRLLLDRLGTEHNLHAILYSAAGQEPRQDGTLWKWTVNRSATIGAMFSRVKKRQMLFPRVADVESFLDEFACETAVYDNLNRTVKYTHPETQQDDALHATNYALLLGILLHHADAAGGHW